MTYPSLLCRSGCTQTLVIPVSFALFPAQPTAAFDACDTKELSSLPWVLLALGSFLYHSRKELTHNRLATQ